MQMPFPLFEVLSMFFSGTTIVGLVIAWKSRKSVLKQTEAEAMGAMQLVYNKMVDDLNERFNVMSVEIKLVKAENFQFQEKVRQLTLLVQDYEKKCKGCVKPK